MRGEGVVNCSSMLLDVVVIKFKSSERLTGQRSREKRSRESSSTVV